MIAAALRRNSFIVTAMYGGLYEYLEIWKYLKVS
jgi:hypothetical protein